MKIRCSILHFASGIPTAGSTVQLLAANPRRVALKIVADGANDIYISNQQGDVGVGPFYHLSGTADKSVLSFEGKESTPKDAFYFGASGADAHVHIIEVFDEEGIRS